MVHPDKFRIASARGPFQFPCSFVHDVKFTEVTFKRGRLRIVPARNLDNILSRDRLYF